METKQEIFDYLMDRIDFNGARTTEYLRNHDVIKADISIAVNKELLTIAQKLYKNIYK